LPAPLELGYKLGMTGWRQTSRPRGSRSHGFSLIELLVTVVIILILTSLYWGGNSSSRQRSLLNVCQKNLQKIFISMEIYANEHASNFPEKAGARTSAEALDSLVPRYTADTSIFICPASRDSAPPSGQPIAKRTISYAYYMGRRSTDQDVLMSDRQIDTRSKPAGQQVFSTNGKAPGNNHRNNGGNFLFCDGHTEGSGSQTPFSLVLTQNVVLLNP